MRILVGREKHEQKYNSKEGSKDMGDRRRERREVGEREVRRGEHEAVQHIPVLINSASNL